MATIRISQTTANTFMADWQTYVSQNPTQLRALFSDTSGNLLTGFQLSFQEYLYLIAPVGIAQFKVRFGINGNGELNLIVWGTDSFGDVITDYFALETYTTATHSKAKFVGYPAIPHAISPLVGKVWLQDWENIGGNIPVELVTIYNSVLNGYTAEARDLYDVLALHTTSAGVEVNIGFVNHKYNAAATDGTLGIAFFSFDDKGTALMLDRATPCPKTC